VLEPRRARADDAERERVRRQLPLQLAEARADAAAPLSELGAAGAAPQDLDAAAAAEHGGGGAVGG